MSWTRIEPSTLPSEGQRSPRCATLARAHLASLKECCSRRPLCLSGRVTPAPRAAPRTERRGGLKREEPRLDSGLRGPGGVQPRDLEPSCLQSSPGGAGGKKRNLRDAKAPGGEGRPAMSWGHVPPQCNGQGDQAVCNQGHIPEGAGRVRTRRPDPSHPGLRSGSPSGTLTT